MCQIKILYSILIERLILNLIGMRIGTPPTIVSPPDHCSDSEKTMPYHMYIFEMLFQLK